MIYLLMCVGGYFFKWLRENISDIFVIPLKELVNLNILIIAYKIQFYIIKNVRLSTYECLYNTLGSVWICDFKITILKCAILKCDF